MLNIHQHSEYSKDAISKVENIAESHRQMGTNSFSITDHGTMSAFPEAFSIATKKDMKFVPGCEIYLTPPTEIDSKQVKLDIAENRRLAKLKRIDKETKETAKNKLEELENVDSRRNFHMTLIAKNQEGLNNLFRSYSEGEQYYDHRISTESVFNHSEGIIVLSGCLGSQLCYYVKTKEFQNARDLIKMYKDKFGDDYYIEIMYHGVNDQKDIDKGYLSEFEVYTKMIELAREQNVKLIATNDGHYTNEEDSGDQELYKDMVYNKQAKDPDSSDSQGGNGDGYYIISDNELKTRLINVGFEENDVNEMIESVYEVENKIEEGINIKQPKKLPDKKEELMDALMEGWERKRKGTKYEQESLDRFKYEVDVIASKDFTAYFINMRDIVKRAYDIGLLTGPSRGSAAGSEVAYLLDITKTDPLYYGLLFERFLNPSRDKMPDIDLDIVSKVSWDDRLGSEILTESLKDKFKFSARINNVVTSSTLMLFKKLCAYYDLPYQMVNKITTNDIGKDMLEGLDSKPNYKDYKENIETILSANNYNEDWDRVYNKLDICYRLDGLVFGFSVHASGVIMTEEWIDLPVDSKGVIDFNGDSLEDYNFIKYDLLSVDALNAVYDLYGLDVDWEDDDDSQVWDVIDEGELEFVFQLASYVPRKMVMDGNPRSIEEIAEVNAINRPGPLGMGLDKTWIDIQNNNHEFEGIEKTLATILKRAFGEKHSGLLVYQEDVMRVFVDAAGFTFSDAENIRKAMGKKDESIMDSFKDKFIEGWVNNEFDDDPEEVWGFLHEFSKYAFNKSHSVGYSQISYINGKMWTYKREEYIEWLLNNSNKRKQEILDVAKNNNYTLEMPSYNNTEQRDRFEIKGNTIYAPVEIEAKYNTASEFLFSSMSKIDKCKLIMMGVLDTVVKDRLALSTIVKNIPEKKLVYPEFPATSDINEILEQGEIAGLWSLEEVDNNIVNVKVNKARSVKEVYLNISNINIDLATISKNIKNDLSNFGVTRKGMLSSYPIIDKSKVFAKFYKIRDQINSLEDEGAEEEKLVKMKKAANNAYREGLRNPIVTKLEDHLEENMFTGYIVDIKYNKKYDNMSMNIMFDNGVYPFYIRNKNMIKKFQSLSKNTAIRMKLNLNSFVSNRKGIKEPTILMGIVDIKS